MDVAPLLHVWMEGRIEPLGERWESDLASGEGALDGQILQAQPTRTKL